MEHYRTWFGHRMLAPDTAGEFVASEPGPLFYRPARPVTRRDLFEVMRTRYEGVNCPEENGDLKIRTIGTTKQSTCHLLEVRGDLPESMCATAWVTFGNAEHIPFLPVNAAISRVEVPYAVNVRTGNWESLDPGTASAHFRRLAALAENWHKPLLFLNRRYSRRTARNSHYPASFSHEILQISWEPDPT